MLSGENKLLKLYRGQMFLIMVCSLMEMSLETKNSPMTTTVEFLLWNNRSRHRDFHSQEDRSSLSINSVVVHFAGLLDQNQLHVMRFLTQLVYLFTFHVFCNFHAKSFEEKKWEVEITLKSFWSKCFYSIITLEKQSSLCHWFRW